MIEEKINGINYKLPSQLSDFQKNMYIHLINWKWKNITKEAGNYKRKDKKGEIITYEYDAILPESVHQNYPIIYPDILLMLKQHKKNFDFKLHEHFNHMASSQAANVNLFLPILFNSKANEVFKELKEDFGHIASDELDHGFRIEFWDGNSKTNNGILGDHSAIAGTDSDIAIAYYNKENELCLWLIEHKLTEKEFTECGGAKSKGRKHNHDCTKSFSEIIENKDLCYYHSGSKYEYWNITQANQSFFINHNKFITCPFKGGMNQLWRNQLLGFAVKKQGKYKQVYFSVVHHPDNDALNESIIQYKELINANPMFSDFTSKKVIDAVSKVSNTAMHSWIDWYKELYNL
jgi:hypothetical protein